MRGNGWPRLVLALVVLGGLVMGSLPAASMSSGGPGRGERLRGGVVATFAVVGERFNVWTTNPDTIAQILALQDGTGSANIPNGVVRRGAGRAGHNRPWHWHLDPRQIEMAEVTIEVCDATPSYVEEHIDEFVENVGRYCAWGARLVRVRDYR